MKPWQAFPIIRPCGVGENIVSMPVNISGDADCYFSEHLDMIVLDDAGQGSVTESVSIRVSMLEDVTSGEGSIK